jgi:hypothetical protein
LAGAIPAGLEQRTDNARKSTKLPYSDAKSGAKVRDVAIDSELQRLIKAWPTLSRKQRQAVLTIMESF